MPTANATGTAGQAAPSPSPTIQPQTALTTSTQVSPSPAALTTGTNHSLAISAPTQSAASNTSSALPPPPLALPITWAEAKPLVAEGKVVLIDARHRPNYEAGHIPGAISLPITSSNEELEAFRKKFPPETKLIVYCSNTSCALSKRLAEQLVYQYHFQNVRYMVGGFVEWQRSELAAPKPGA